MARKGLAPTEGLAVLSKLRSQLTYANVLSTVCLFIVLGGTSYAVATGSIDSREIKNNTVRSKDIRNNTVGSKDIRNNTVRSRDVRDFSLLAKDFALDQLPAGPLGPQGEQGVPGQPGQDATKLFAYIRDLGSADTANVVYGSGVTAFSDVIDSSSYTVIFNRSLTNCVVHAVPGVGDPQGGSAAVLAAFPHINMAAAGANGVEVTWADHANVGTDTSFLLTAFC